MPQVGRAQEWIKDDSRVDGEFCNECKESGKRAARTRLPQPMLVVPAAVGRAGYSCTATGPLLPLPFEGDKTLPPTSPLPPGLPPPKRPCSGFGFASPSSPSALASPPPPPMNEVKLRDSFFKPRFQAATSPSSSCSLTRLLFHSPAAPTSSSGSSLFAPNSDASTESAPCFLMGLDGAPAAAAAAAKAGFAAFADFADSSCAATDTLFFCLIDSAAAAAATAARSSEPAGRPSAGLPSDSLACLLSRPLGVRALTCTTVAAPGLIGDGRAFVEAGSAPAIDLGCPTVEGAAAEAGAG
mmetsp:Transcript_16798/g.37667  ORF Transcript_16798/g.37667 Transcript_16798/m.37667 type:complete len:298 (+) Transcript_16798:189-1082(+)